MWAARLGLLAACPAQLARSAGALLPATWPTVHEQCTALHPTLQCRVVQCHRGVGEVDDMHKGSGAHDMSGCPPPPTPPAYV